MARSTWDAASRNHARVTRRAVNREERPTPVKIDESIVCVTSVQSDTKRRDESVARERDKKSEGTREGGRAGEVTVAE
ncbi:hypothetical protein ANTRET_LOCUS4605 [Anthophora retusa]